MRADKEDDDRRRGSAEGRGEESSPAALAIEAENLAGGGHPAEGGNSAEGGVESRGDRARGAGGASEIPRGGAASAASGGAGRVLLRVLKEYSILTLGLLITAVGIFFFKFPNNFCTGGVAGISVILTSLFPNFSPTLYMTALNLLLILVGFIFLGRDFGVKTLYGSLVLTGLLDLFDALVPARVFAVEVVRGEQTLHTLTGDAGLELLWAVALPAIGSAILFYNHGSTGGTDILAMILRKHTPLDSGKALLCTDATIVIVSFFLFDPTTGLSSLMGMLLKSVVVDNLIDGLGQSKKFMIVTSKREVVESFITDELHRSATVWECEGAYSGDRKFAFISVMNRVQSLRMRNYLREVDPQAFVIVTNSSDIIGKGFHASD